MDLKDLRKKNKGEISKMVDEKKAALSNFKFGVIGGKTKNVKEGKNLRKEIAQLLTVVKEIEENIK
jgi:ribosomal protein L29